MCRQECVHTVCEHVCLCLTHLRNSRGPWVQANFKTEQGGEAEGNISRGRSHAGATQGGRRKKRIF